jgi:hypothetical protein
MSHHVFQDCCAKTAEFITPALPDLAKAWKKWKAPKPKEKPAHPYLTRPLPRDFKTLDLYAKAMKRYKDTMPKHKKKVKK